MSEVDINENMRSLHFFIQPTQISQYNQPFQDWGEKEREKGMNYSRRFGEREKTWEK
jgi:hypothetical protein